MPPLSNTITIDAPADDVWDIVAHAFDRIGDWATVIPSSAATTASTPLESAPLDAPVTGRVCRTGIRAVPEVTETIVAYDESARTLTYEATAGLPAFVTLARNTWQVTPLSQQQTQVTYSGRLEVRGLIGRLAKRRLLARVARDGRHLLDDLKHYAEHGQPSPRKLRDPVAAVGTRPTSRHLRAAMRTNAVFSLVSGLALITGAWRSPILPMVGVPVAGFGLLVARLAAAPAEQLRRQAIPVIAADIGWVAASIAVLVLVHLPSAAATAVATVAATVAVLAGSQAAGLGALRRDDPLADLEVIEASRQLPIAPHRIWPLLSDHQTLRKARTQPLRGRGDQPTRRNALVEGHVQPEHLLEPGAPRSRQRCPSHGSGSCCSVVRSVVRHDPQDCSARPRWWSACGERSDPRSGLEPVAHAGFGEQVRCD